MVAAILWRFDWPVKVPHALRLAGNHCSMPVPEESLNRPKHVAILE